VSASSSDYRISRGHQTRPRVRFVKINQSLARHGAGVGADPGGETDSGPLRNSPCSVNRAHNLWTTWVSREKIEFVRSALADRASVEYFHQDRNYLYGQTRSTFCWPRYWPRCFPPHALCTWSFMVSSMPAVYPRNRLHAGTAPVRFESLVCALMLVS
jgi:hypothetical protein